ncbi:hypothetical protein EGW08_015044 [Elysia chlorotica]|uniref:G-protein coupled receptors family 1 profile domain-containing protein n=1 Tax=Elysia chlorotica TaxID=188477 RepID=A0A3S1HDJ4_ELYCH|nr:hypothetical protein EGW08_015044 [Elysia chlorotica]
MSTINFLFYPPELTRYPCLTMCVNHSVVENDSNINLNDPETWVYRFESFNDSAQFVFSCMFFGTGFLGGVGNILTIFIFAKMGWTNTFHISCTALAVSDLCCVLAIAMTGVTSMGIFNQNFNRSPIYYLCNIAGVVFSRTTAVLTAWISLERCLSVIFPIKVKLIITRTVTVVSNVIIFITSVSIIGFIFASFQFFKEVDNKTNSSSMVLIDGEQPELNGFREFSKLLLGAVVPIFSWVTVIICTAFLIVKMRNSRKWRKVNAWAVQKGVVTTSKNQLLPVREKRAIKVVLAVAVLFLICSLPMSVHLMVSFFIEDYFRNGSLHYVFNFNAMVVLFLSQVNSCINIIVYTLLGHIFRSVLFRLFCGGD